MVEAIVGVALRAILASVLLGGVLAGIVLVATRTLSLNAATRHALWTTALIATAVMPLAGIGMSLARAAAPALVASPMPAAVPASTLAAVPKHQQSSPKHAKAAPSAPFRAGTTAVPAPAATTLADRLAFARSAPRVSRTLALGVVGLWLGGALIGLIGLAASIVRVRGLKRRSSPLDGTLADDLPWLTEVDTGREIYLRLSFETETPVAIGFRRPVILIPTELATADGLAAIEQLVLHEHAHLRRYDDWTNLIQRTIERIFWFNPIVWLVGRKIALEREIASDDAVVDKTGEPHAYATSLWKLAREMRMPEHAVVAPGALLTRKQITIRIEQLLDKKRARLHRSPIAALGVGLAGILAVAFVATSAPAVELPPGPPSENVTATATKWHADDSARIAKAHPTPISAFGAHAVKPAAGLTQPSAFGKPPTAGIPVATTPREQRVIRILQSQVTPQSPKQLAASIEIDQTTGTPELPALPVLPPAALAPPAVVPPAIAPPAIAQAVPSLSPTALRKIRAVASAAAAHARSVHDTESIGTDVAKVIHEVTATLPRELAHEIAQEGSTPARVRTDGLKLSRDMISSCVGCSFRNADARGLDLHGLRINADDFSGADMRGVNLSGAQLVGVSLAGANLSNADLRNAQLTGVELRGTNFDGAQLEGIKLMGASVKHVSLRGTTLRSLIANCTGCDFAHFDLRGQDLHGLNLNGANFSDADLRNANLAGAQLVGVSLARTNMSKADLRNAQLNGSDLRDANLDGALLEGVKLIGMSVKRVSLRGTTLRSVVANCTGCDFSGLDLHGQDLHGITLNGANLSHADLHDANLSGARFSGVSLVRANLAGADLTNAHFEGCDLTSVDLRGARTTGMTTQGSGLNG